MKIFASFFLCVLAGSAVGCGKMSSLLSKAEKEIAAPAAKEPPAEPVAVAPTPSPSQVAPALAVGGVYDVRGTNPSGTGNYSGTAMISQQAGDAYRIDWSVGNSYTGTGTRQGNNLTVEWGDGTKAVGTVKYNIESDGRLTGVWYTHANPNQLGSEILMPKR